MKIAIPVADKKLSMHFGHCESFEIFDVEPSTKSIVNRSTETPPPHEPGVLPAWLADMGASLIIAGGMGNRAQMLFQQNNVEVIVGAPPEAPEEVVAAYLNNSLTTGTNCCDH